MEDLKKENAQLKRRVKELEGLVRMYKAKAEEYDRTRVQQIIKNIKENEQAEEDETKTT